MGRKWGGVGLSHRTARCSKQTALSGQRSRQTSTLGLNTSQIVRGPGPLFFQSSSSCAETRRDAAEDFVRGWL